MRVNQPRLPEIAPMFRETFWRANSHRSINPTNNREFEARNTMGFTPARQAAIILLAGFGLSFYWFFPTYSADLMATWLAGQFLAVGQPEQVYPAIADTFQMYPPSQWRDFMAQEYQYEGPIFPFLYPPIWAKFGELLAHINFWRLTAVVLVINSALLVATVHLAYRATKSTLHPAIFAAIALFFLFGNHIGTIALQQNQPQILVSFLLVLMVERMRNNAPVVAGTALAIAAAIKIYPAFFAVFWLFTRERRALGAFVIIGGALGVISILWAGWPLHQAFLDQVRLISGSILVTGITFNVDAAVAQLLFRPDLIWIPGQEGPSPANPNPGWYVMGRPAIWQGISNLVMFGAIAVLILAFRRARSSAQTTLLWPLAFTVVSLLSPISWAYYFIPAACFAPVLLAKLGPKTGSIFLLLSFGPIFGPLIQFYRRTENLENWPPYIYPIIAVVALSVLAFGFFLAARRETGAS